MTEISTTTFIEEVGAAIREGYGFVPFVGAGFSAPSGVPLIVELEEYLRKCICIALRLDEKGAQNVENHQPWNPRTDQWPPLVDRSLPKKRGEWEKALHQKIVEQRPIVQDAKGGPRRPKDDDLRVEANELVAKYAPQNLSSADRQKRVQQRFKELKRKETSDFENAKQRYDDNVAWLKIYSEGFGAMQDWRTALLFLSRLEPPTRGNGTNLTCPTLTPPQPEVVDACFREVLKNRYPTLGHRMLGALAGAMRIDLVLTTNFDTLLERAFETARNPIEVYEVLLDDSLPRRTEIESHRTLVKLHGGRVALRADYSLDVPPSAQDKDRFLSYLLSPGGRHEYTHYRKDRVNDPRIEPSKGGYAFDKHIVMLGFSAADKRINLLVKEALARLSPDFRVYWIYFSAQDLEKLRDEFGEAENRIRPVACTNTGFLLLELYQSLRGTLPPLGSIFPSASRLTLPPITPEAIDQRLKSDPGYLAFVKNLEKKIWSEIDGSWTKVIATYPEEDTEGLTSACAATFRSIETSSEIVSLWVDLNNVSSADNLYEVLLEAVYYRIGVEEWIPSTTTISRNSASSATFQRRAREFARLLRTVNKKWVIFLNARETPGANTYEEEISNSEDRNGWLGFKIEDDDGNASPEDFVQLIVALCREQTPESPGEAAFSGAPLTIVLMATGANSKVTQPGTWGAVKHTTLPLPKLATKGSNGPGTVATNCLQWTNGGANTKENQQRLRFLHALVLMQRPRFPSAIWSAAFFNDHNAGAPSPVKWKDTTLWLERLQGEGLVRFKPGGMVWVHSEVRKKLRDQLSSNTELGDIHVNIAAWYEKAIDASDSPDAVFEAAYHFCKAAQALCRRNHPASIHASSDYSRATALVDAATAKVKSESYLIQTHGYSRGSCRQLAHLAKIGQAIWDEQKLDQDLSAKLAPPGAADLIKLKRSISELWLGCVETMRAVAREVGEDKKAFYRHRQIATLYLNRPTATWDHCKSSNPGNPKKPSLRDPFGNGLSKKMHEACARRRISRACLWRWERWTTMLHIESRDYQKAEDVLHGRDPRVVNGKTIPEWEALIGKLGNQAPYDKIPFHDAPREPLELLRLLEKAVELQMLRFGVEMRLGNFSPTRLGYAEQMIRRGLKLAAKIRDSDYSSGSRDLEGVSWCEMRLLMHLSVVHARAEQCNFQPRLARDPLGILGDAEAKLRVSDPQRTRAELALIDLHRSEVRLYAPEIRVLDRTLRYAINGLLFTPPRKTPPPKRRLRRLRVAGAAVMDAVRFLDRAESVLRERRRNVWWTTWYFERKLRAIGYAVLASCAEKGSLIPFLGLEAAMRETDTEADRLLEDAVRMIRVDSYRMAAVVRAYADCLVALVVRLAYDETLPRLPLRLDAMQEKLKKAVIHIDEVNGLRNETAKVDGDVKALIKKVVRDVENLLSSPHFTDLLRRANDLAPQATVASK